MNKIKVNVAYINNGLTFNLAPFTIESILISNLIVFNVLKKSAD